MKKIAILLVLFSIIFFCEAKSSEFLDRTSVGLLVGPLMPGGDDAETLSTGYYIGIDARYQIFRFMAVGVSIGRNAWGGEPAYEVPGTEVEISSSKTNTCVSFHFGPSAPTWGTIATYEEGSIQDVKPYPPGMFVPFFVFDIGPYFWSWTETTAGMETWDGSGTELMVRGTLSVFYQYTKMVSFLAGLSYTMYDFNADFSSTGIIAGIRFNMGEVFKDDSEKKSK